MEYYDYTKDSIKSYFMEKIQIVLASKESLRLIIQKQKAQENVQNTSRRMSKEIDVSSISSNNEKNSVDATCLDTTQPSAAEDFESNNYLAKESSKMNQIKEEFSEEDDEDSGKENPKVPEQRTAQLLRMTPRVIFAYC